MGPFRLYWLKWIAAYPVTSAFLLIFALILLAALLPLLVSLLPIRKVPLTYNLRNLQVRWKTTLVTALAFTLVTALLTFMLAFVRGMDALTEESGHPGNVLVLSDGATDEAFSNLPKFRVELLPRDLQKLIPHYEDGERYLAAQEVYVVATYQVPLPRAGGPTRRFVQMRGLDDLQVAAAVHELELAQGSWPSASGVRAITVTGEGGAPRQDTAPEVVLGESIARTLGIDAGKEALVPGDTVRIGPRRWFVVGILKAGVSTFGSEVWARDTFIQEYFGRTNSYSSYVVRTADARTARLAAELLKEFRSERNLQATPERVYYAKLSQTNRQFSVAAYVVAIIMAIGGVLGVMNTMFAAISQRTKDVGVLRLMGYRRWQILCSFQAESLLMALLGGALGCALGSLCHGMTATSIVSGGAGGGKSVVLRLIVDFGVLRTCMTFALLMGALGGILPSWRAMRLRPLESLK